MEKVEKGKGRGRKGMEGERERIEKQG